MSPWPGSRRLSGPLQAIFARGALASGSTGVAANNGGYGPLVPVPDETDGVVRLHLPEGFEYRSFTPTGTPMDDGVATPGRHDGMAAFDAGPSRYRLVRNHEVNGPGPRLRRPPQGLRPDGRGGTTTLEVNRHADQGRVVGELQRHADELRRRRHAVGQLAHLRGDRQRPRRRQRLHGRRQRPAPAASTATSSRCRSHGTPGEHRQAGADPLRRPLRARGCRRRPADGDPLPDGGQLRLPVGLLPLHRAAEPGPRRSASRTAAAGDAQGRGHAERGARQGSDARRDLRRRVGQDRRPRPDVRDRARRTTRRSAVGAQGRAKGAATFSRLEGIFYDDGQGLPRLHPGRRHACRRAAPGRLRRRLRAIVGPRHPPADADAAVRVAEPQRARAPGQPLHQPPQCSLLCEDGPTENYLRGVTPDGKIFDFARNAIAGRQQEEFAGSTFTPDGKVLFVNIQASTGVTFAIWGPWKRGVL